MDYFSELYKQVINQPLGMPGMHITTMVYDKKGEVFPPIVMI